MKQRDKEFIKCLGHGKSIYECESENDDIDEYNLKEMKRK